MYATRIIEWVLIVTVVVEVIIPGIFGRPLFPILRRRSKASRLLAEQEKLRMQLEEDRLQQENDRLKQKHNENVSEKEKAQNVQQN